MAHTVQQRKRNRQNEKQYATNKARRSRVATMVKKFETAVGSTESTGLAASFKQVMSELAKAARLGAISKGSAARKTSRLAARAKKVQSAPQA